MDPVSWLKWRLDLITFSLIFKICSVLNIFIKVIFLSWKCAHCIQFCSVAQLCLTLCDLMDRSMPDLPVHHRLHGLCPWSRWCHPTISSSVIPFSSLLQSFPPSGSFQMSQFFTSRGQSIGVSASASVLPMNIQDWFPLGWTGWISLHSKGLARVFSNTTVQKHQFFSTQLSLYSSSHIHTWYWKKHSFDWQTFVGKVMSLLFNMLSRLVITFLPRSKHLLISWQQSPSAMILEPKKINSATVSHLFAMKWWDHIPLF